MFTGIIETSGTLEKIIENGSNKTFWINSPISTELKTDQSVAHDGACLTIEEVQGNSHRVTAIHETLLKTNLGAWKTGGQVNLERCMLLNGRLDGHIVQGHVDTTATCSQLAALDGSWEYTFTFPEQFGHLVIEKGSVTLNGISLTLFNVQKDTFQVAIIPYTFGHTNIRLIQPGDTVNIEFDMIGKYVSRIAGLKAVS